MAEKNPTDAVLRVISNRCRNLRKVLDRTLALQTAQAQGQLLNDEQNESVRDLPKKEALLAELQEILKKQTAIVEPPPPPPQPKLSRRAQKAARAKARALEGEAKSTSEKSIEEGERQDAKNAETTPEPSGEAPDQSVNGVTSENDSQQGSQHGSQQGSQQGSQHDSQYGSQQGSRHGSQYGRSQMIDHANERKSIAMGVEEREVLLREMADLKLNHEHQLLHFRADAVRKTLNLFHVAEFLRQPGSREALLSYYNNLEARHTPFVLNGVHLDIISYFYVMLTSPNGNVPHPEAVQVSTAHCLGYLQGSNAEAFKGTPYSMLVEIVNTIACCPILTERGVDPEKLNKNRRVLDNVGSGSKIRRVAAVAGIEPSHVVGTPVTGNNHP